MGKKDKVADYVCKSCSDLNVPCQLVTILTGNEREVVNRFMTPEEAEIIDAQARENARGQGCPNTNYDRDFGGRRRL